ERKKHEENRGPGSSPSTPTSATQLRGLAYLPADTNIVFAVQPGPFLAHAKDKGQDPGEFLTRAGLPRSVLNVASDLGLSLEQIDHDAGGTFIGDGAFDPRFTLALVLRQPLADEEDFLKRLKAKKQVGGKSRYDVSLGALPMTMVRVSPTEWVFGLELGATPAKNLDAVDRKYELGGKQFPPVLAEVIATRVPPDAAAWIATNEEEWAQKAGVKLVVGNLMKRPEWLPSLARGRAAMAAISLGEKPRLHLFVKAADDASGRRIRDYFRSLATDPKAKSGGEGTTVLYESPIDPAAVYTTVQKMFDASEKE
ncbi:MAG TPA: hypothetical protein VLM40_13410, partial [Gemmata sp.]|nr:hypothetical protein [Gemmata sp.]